MIKALKKSFSNVRISKKSQIPKMNTLELYIASKLPHILAIHAIVCEQQFQKMLNERKKCMKETIYIDQQRKANNVCFYLEEI